MTWLRENPWRQGSVLSYQAYASAYGREAIVSWPRLHRLASGLWRILIGNLPFTDKVATLRAQLTPSRAAFDYGIVISHDCDIACERLADEPFIEFCRASIVPKASSQFAGAKNSRRLHLPAAHMGNPAGNPVFLELRAYDRFRINKADLSLVSPDREIGLPASSLQILKHWLASRYRRQALPTELDKRLVPVRKALEKFERQDTSGIYGLWLSYDPELELSPDEEYEFKFYVVYSTDQPNGQTQAGLLVERLQELRKKVDGSGTTVGVKGLDWVALEAKSDEEWTLRDIRHTVKYVRDHVSLLDEPQSPTVD